MVQYCLTAAQQCIYPFQYYSQMPLEYVWQVLRIQPDTEMVWDVIFPVAFHLKSCFHLHPSHTLHMHGHSKFPSGWLTCDWTEQSANESCGSFHLLLVDQGLWRSSHTLWTLWFLEITWRQEPWTCMNIIILWGRGKPLHWQLCHFIWFPTPQDESCSVIGAIPCFGTKLF